MGTLKTFLKYRNIDSSKELNTRLQALTGKGIFSGGNVSPVALQLKVNVDAFFAVGADGMVTQHTGTTQLDVTAGITQHVILRAIYRDNQAPTVQLQVLSNAAYLADPDLAKLVRFCTITLGGGDTQVSNSQIDYSTADRVDMLSRFYLRGTIANFASLASLLTAPSRVRIGDIYFAIAENQFYLWNGTTWIPTGDQATINSIVTHRANGFVDEKHLTDLQYAGVNAPFGGAMTGGNPPVTQAAVQPGGSFLIYGTTGILAARRVDGANATGATSGVPFRFRAGDNATVALEVQAFTGSTQHLFRALDSTGTFLVGIGSDGKILWNSGSFLQSDGANQIHADLGSTTDIVKFLSTPGTLTEVLASVNGGHTIIVRANVASTEIRSVGAGYLAFFVAGSEYWRILPTGELQAQGGNLAIQNVLDPVTAQDAATKAYADTLYRPSNAVMNGAFNLWQREQTFTVTPANTRIFVADRWYALGGGTAANSVVTRETDAPTHMRYSLKNQRPNGDTDTSARNIIQEIDRDVVRQLRGRRVRLTFWAKRGSTPFHGALNVSVAYGTGAETQVYTGGYTGSTSIIGPSATSLSSSWARFTLLSSAIVSTSANTMAVVFTHNPSATAAFLDEAFLISGVMLTDAGITTPYQADPNEQFVWFGGDMQSDHQACLRYYSKSYLDDVAPSTITFLGLEQQIINPLSLADGSNFIKFPVQMRITPTVTVYDHVGIGPGLPGNWNKNGVAFAASATAVSAKNFNLNMPSGGALNDILSGHWTADAEI